MLFGLVETSVEAEAEDVDLLTAGARLVLPLPLLFSFVKVESFLLDDPVTWAVAVAVKSASDQLGYLGGGALEVADAASKL